MRRIRAICIGIGMVGRGINKMMAEKGVEIVSAIDMDPEKIGKDLGDVIDMGRPLNVFVTDDLDKVLAENEADIAVVCVASFETSYPIYVKCIENGLNVVTTDDQSTYPWSLYPELASKLDKLAKKHQVTITASGNQDILGVNLPIMMSGCCASVASITAKVKTNLNLVGPQSSKDFHVGDTIEQFHSHVADKNEYRPFRHYGESIAAKLGLTVERIEFRDEPTIDDVEVECLPLKMIVKKGLVTGKTTFTEIHTAQGIVVGAEYTVKVFRDGEEGLRAWAIKGVPDLTIDYTAPGVPAVTRNTQLVNRIPDIINMTPGFVTTENYPINYYRHFPLHHYIKDNAD